MNLAEMIVLIVFIAVVGGVLKARYGSASVRTIAPDPEADRLR